MLIGRISSGVQRHSRRRKMRHVYPWGGKEVRGGKIINVSIFTSKMLKNSPTSLFNFKIFQGVIPSDCRYKGDVKGDRGSCIMAIGG